MSDPVFNAELELERLRVEVNKLKTGQLSMQLQVAKLLFLLRDAPITAASTILRIPDDEGSLRELLDRLLEGVLDIGGPDE